MTSPIITVPQAKDQINIPAADATYDTELAGYVAAASKLVEDYRHEVVVQRTVVEYLPAPRTAGLLLGSTPVVALLEVTRVDGLTTWNVADFRIEDPASGRVGGPLLSGALRVTYTAGYASPPANLVLATKLIVQYLWESQQRASVGPNPVGGMGEYMTPAGVGAGIPPAAVALLGGRPPVIA